MANLSLKHIYKIYDNGTKAVDDFNLEIGSNEFIVFVGPSGCGKSTTLRMIAGLEDITAGDFLIDGVLANGLEPKERDMAMVFQNYALYPHMTVYDNMAFGLRIRHVNKNEIDKRVQEAARILDIQDQLQKKPKEMSGGQRQRVALGRAIVRKPKVFLLDEPLSNLDAKLRSQMRSEITRLHNVLKTTFIYVTHDQVEAMTMGTRIVVMKKGVIQQVDKPMNLYDYPSNIFVAGFIGTPQMNFIKGKISFDRNKDYVLSFGKNKVTVKHETFFKLNENVALENRDVVIGCRPEHFAITSKSDKNAFDVKIEQIEALGNEANIIVNTLDNENNITIRVLRDDSLKIGDVIRIKFIEEKVHLFDKETTNTLLPRIPESFTFMCEQNAGKISLFGNQVQLPKKIQEQIKSAKELKLFISKDSIVSGNTFNLSVLNCEEVNDKIVANAKSGNSFISVNVPSKGKSLQFSIDFSKVTFVDNKTNEVLFNAINSENVIQGKLEPVKRPMLMIKDTFVTSEEADRITRLAAKEEKPRKVVVKNKKANVFNYSLLSTQIIPSEADIIKIYALLGKKFYLHDISYSIDASKIEIVKSGIPGTVSELLDFGGTKYLRVKVENNSLLVEVKSLDHKEGDRINLHIEEGDLGIVDNNFGVKLI